MLDDKDKPDSLDATARDYLGQPSPLAFKNQPALPSGGGSIAVGAGPNTTAGGTGAGTVKRDAAFTKMLADLGLDQDGGGGDGNSGAESAAGVAAPAITGFDPTTANIGFNVATTAMGVPGAVGLLGALAGLPGLATSVPNAGLISAGGKALGAATNFAGVTPESNLTLATPGSPGKSSVTPTYSGLFSALANAIMGRSNFTVSDDPTPTGAVNLSNPADSPSIYSGTNVPGVTNDAGFGVQGHPSFGYGGSNAPSQSPATFAQTPSVFGQGRGDTPDGTGTGGGGDKVVCTAMNRAYGFGAFRNAVWLAYAREHLTPAHQRGYHWWGKPMVRYAYGGTTLPRRVTRAVMEHVARHRTADLWREMRGGKRDALGRVYRAILEPLCFAIGQWA